MRIISYSILVILLFLGITFACLNHNPVAINYYVGEKQVALSLLLVLVFAVGGVLGLLAGFFVMVRLKAENRRLKHKLKKANGC